LISVLVFILILIPILVLIIILITTTAAEVPTRPQDRDFAGFVELRESFKTPPKPIRRALGSSDARTWPIDHDFAGFGVRLGSS